MAAENQNRNRIDIATYKNVTVGCSVYRVLWKKCTNMNIGWFFPPVDDRIRRCLIYPAVAVRDVTCIRARSFKVRNGQGGSKHYYMDPVSAVRFEIVRVVSEYERRVVSMMKYWGEDLLEPRHCVTRIKLSSRVAADIHRLLVLERKWIRDQWSTYATVPRCVTEQEAARAGIGFSGDEVDEEEATDGTDPQR